MRNEELGRLGVACIIAVLGALVEGQLELCPELQEAAGEPMSRIAIFWWLLMIVGCGVILDATQGTSRPRLVVAAIFVASVFLGVAVYMAALDRSEQFCFSGLSKSHPAMVPLMIALWFVTAIGVFLLSFSRPLLKKLLKAVSDDRTPKRIATMEKTIRAAISALAVLALLVGISLY